MTHGRVHKFGDHIDTDIIIPARWCVSIKPEDLGPHAMEGLVPGWAEKVSQGDVIVAGENFGCGSSRETAPVALLAAGIRAVIAVNFARIFFRNCVNVGLPIVECPQAVTATQEGDEVTVDPAAGLLKNTTRGLDWKIPPWPDNIQAIIAAGGMVPFVRKYLNS